MVYPFFLTTYLFEGYRFGPPINTFDTPATNPDNACFCPPGTMERDGNCGTRGLFNISSCKFGAPMSISWPHFLYGDPKLLENVEGLSPDPNRHGFYMDFQPVFKSLKNLNLFDFLF